MIHSFLLIGQSNMAGRGFRDEVAPIQNNQLKVLRNGRWQDMFFPVNPDRPFSGINLAESFADLYAKEYGVEVGLIPCADGGTSMEQWAKGGLLYDHAVFQARLAARTSQIRGILWHQGEADCGEQLYPLYEEKLFAMLNALRTELGCTNVPLLLGGLGDFLKDCPLDANLVNYPQINAALRRVSERMENVAFVSAEGLGSNPDHLHFNATALREFGERYYKVYRTMQKDCTDWKTEKATVDDTARSAMEAL